MIKAQPFSRLLLNKMLLISLVSVVLALIMTALSSLVLFKTLTQNEVEQLQFISEKEIDDHLSTGWTPNNVSALFKHLNKTYPNHSFTLLTSPQHDQNERNKLSTSLYKLLHQIESKQIPLTEVHLLQGTILGGTPIIFESKCLTCHVGTAKIGEYAGTLLFQMPLSSFQTSISSSILFTALFFKYFSKPHAILAQTLYR